MSFSKLDIAKTAARYIVGAGAGKIAKDIIKANTNPASRIDVITYAAGGLALGGVVADVAKDYTGKKIDEVVEMVEKHRPKVQGIDKDAAIEVSKETAEKVRTGELDIEKAIADAKRALGTDKDNS